MSNFVALDGEPTKLDPPRLLAVMTENEKGERDTSMFTVDLMNWPEPERNDGYLWAEKDGIMVVGYSQKVVLGWETHQ